jgi:hypothetical protein
MKKSALALICMSFLLFAACGSFEQTTDIDMASMATMTIPGGTVQLSGNPVWVTAATTRISVTEQYLLLKIVCTTGQIDTAPRILRIKGTAANFNAQSIVDLPIIPEFAWTDTPLGEVHGRASNMAEFVLTIGEAYVFNNEYFEEWTAQTQTIKILKGQLDDYELARLAADTENFFSWYIQDGRFLSKMAGNAAAPKVVVVNNIADPVKMWFSFFGLELLPNHCLVSGTYSDGTYFQHYIPIDQLSPFGLIEINCHQMAINWSDVEKTVVEYQVTMHNFGIEPLIRVQVLNKYTENHQVLYAQNRYGVVEAINLYGESEETGAINQEEFTLQKPLTPSLTQGTIEAEKKDGQNGFNLNTGYKTLEERRWIKDLLLSPYRRFWLRSTHLPEIGELGYGFVPVIITSNSYLINTTSEDILDIKIELKIAHIN